MSEFLKCDAPGCGHTEDVQEINEGLIGKPCEKCGANLLTGEDYEFYSANVRPAYQALIAVGVVRPVDEAQPGDKRVRVNYHDGSMNIKIEDVI